MAAAAAAMEWKFSQVFGERAPSDEVEDVDIISAVEFESRGEYLATGDHGGRVVLFERSDEKDVHSRKELEHMDYPASARPRYIYKTEFQSHEPEFDYLKSLEIEEKINKLRWCTAANNSLFILSTNDRTVKLWKVLEQKVKKVKELDLSPYVSSENALLAEKSFMVGQYETSGDNGHLEWINKQHKGTTLTSQEGPSTALSTREGSSSRCRRVYAHAHDYNINSISNNSDGETFISADDLRINLWNLEISNQCFNIIDMKPSDMEDLVEVITAAEFHPTCCNLLAYSSSRGFIRLVDMRQSALCDKNSRILQDRESHGSRSFFTEIVTSVSDIKFAMDGRHILSRDYMNLKLWDLNMENSPIATYKIHEFLRPKVYCPIWVLAVHFSAIVHEKRLAELYNNDSIFDKFGCCLSSGGSHFATGSYSNTFRVFSRDGGPDEGIALEATRTPNRITHLQNGPKSIRLLTNIARGHKRRGGQDSLSDTSSGMQCDLTSKLTHLAWHPTANLIACAAANSLYMYHA